MQQYDCRLVILSFLLVLNAANQYTTVGLTCGKRFCTLFDLASVEDTFVYQYVSRHIVQVILDNVLLERLDGKVLRQYPPFVKCVDVQNSATITVMSVPVNVTCLRIVATGLSKINFVQRSALLRLMVEKSQLNAIPCTIENARSLTFLEIVEANVRHLDLGTLCEHSRLESIVLKRNKIRYVRNSATRSCPLYDALVFLKLKENRLKSLNLMLFSRFRRLNFFDISNNRLASISTGTLTLDTIERFDMNNNRLTEISFCTWMLPRLRSLMLWCNSLTVVPACVQSWTNISFLSLTSNKLTSFAIESVAGLDNLQQLYLAWNRIEFVKLNGAQFPSSLELLDITGNLLHQLDLSFVPSRSLTVKVEMNFITGLDVNSTTANGSASHLTSNPIDCSWTLGRVQITGVPCLNGND
ncbi:leucine-rich repeat-containing protein let-4-like [Anopheles stephensi]|uniref:leucine-rich repeat-containing protein let-4-like n=1 Tax=Anopheles stephensi TaxID=30069 RepID=UPI0016587FD1|nr:leucine-rich repeat-containing protein let-4-like [Anopheles stephensi]